MAIHNLLRESILEAKKLKQVSAESTKDRLLEELTSDLKRKIRQQDKDQNIPLDDDDDEITEQEQEFNDDLDDQIQEAINDLQNDDEQSMVNQQDDQEIQDIITELEDQQELDQPITEDEDEEDDQALIERITSILESQDEEQEETVTEEQDIQGIQQIIPDDQVVESFRKKVKQLTSENKKYKNYLQKINQQLNEAKCLQMKGNYAIKLFNKFNLTKNQKMAIIENFDRAKNEREIKLVYATLFQGLKDINTKKRIRGTRPVVSSKIKSTKSRVRQNRDIIDDDYQSISEIFRRKVGILD